MSSHTFISENTKSTVLIAPSATGSAQEAYLDPDVGSMGCNLRAIVTMGNAADLVLTLKFADDATGTTATDFPIVVPIYVDGVREAADAITYTVGEDTGDFIVDFCIDPGLIPDGKFVGLHQGSSNAASFITTLAIENSTSRPSV